MGKISSLGDLVLSSRLPANKPDAAFQRQASMEHKIRWTSQKIAERLKLIESLVYRTRQALPAFRYLPLSGPEEDPPVESNVDDSGWDSVAPFTM